MKNLDIVTWEEVEKYLESLIEDNPQPTALIKHEREGCEGVAIRLCENLTEAYKEGNCIVFWDDGEHGVCNPEDKIQFIRRIL